MGMRFLPFSKAKKGWQFAGQGADTGGGGGGTYTLPVASANTLGGVKVGSGLSITSSGVLSASGGGGGGGSYSQHVQTINVPSCPTAYGVGEGSVLARIQCQAGKTYLITVEQSWNNDEPNGVQITTYTGVPDTYTVARSDGSSICTAAFVSNGTPALAIYARWKSSGSETLTIKYVEIDTPISQ